MLLAAVVLGGGAVAADRFSANPTRSSEPAQAVIVPVRHVSSREQYDVTLRGSFDDAFVVSIQSSGTVTGLRLRVGETLGSGSRLMDVDDRPIIGFVSPAPLYRDLSPGDRGPDVRRLGQFLHDLGLLHVVSDRFDAGMAAAVTSFNDRHGRPESGDRFDLGSVAWLGAHETTLESTRVNLGAHVQGTTPIASGPRRLGSVTVVEPEGGVAPVEGGYVLQVGQLDVGYAAGSRRIDDPRTLSKLQPFFATGRSVSGALFATFLTRSLDVPASAVVVGPDGSTCVFTAVDRRPTRVQVVNGELGTASVTANGPLQSVIANPGELGLGLSCGS